jgi:hypothetical protein
MVVEVKNHFNDEMKKKSLIIEGMTLNKMKNNLVVQNCLVLRLILYFNQELTKGNL